jgi:hypothetical protein
LQRHSGGDRADHLPRRGAHAQPIQSGKMRNRNRKRGNNRNRQDAVGHRDIGESNHRHPDDVEERDHDPDRVGPKPIKPTDAVFALLFAREPVGPGQ